MDWPCQDFNQGSNREQPNLHVAIVLSPICGPSTYGSLYVLISVPYVPVPTVLCSVVLVQYLTDPLLCERDPVHNTLGLLHGGEGLLQLGVN